MAGRGNLKEEKKKKRYRQESEERKDVNPCELFRGLRSLHLGWEKQNENAC